MTDFLINLKTFFKNHLKFTRKDLYFGISLLLIAYYLNNITNSLNGYFSIKVPINAKNNSLFVKKFPNGEELILFYQQNKLTHKFYYVIKKNNIIIDKGLCFLPMNYYNSKVTFHFKNNNLKCLIGTNDYLTKIEDKKRLKENDDYIIKNYTNKN